MLLSLRQVSRQISRQVSPRRALTIVHDVLITGVAIVTAFLLRLDIEGVRERLDELAILLPGFLLYAAFVYQRFRLYRSRWRFASLPDAANILGASTVLALTLVVIDYILVAPNVRGSFLFGKLTIVIYWLLQMFLLGGPRIAYRYLRYARSRRAAMAANATPVLIVGRAADAEVLMRAIESGAVKRIWPAGILSDAPADYDQEIRGVLVRGRPDELARVVAEAAERGRPVSRIILMPSALEPQASPEKILIEARRLGLATQRLPSLDEGSAGLALAPLQVEDLLLRRSVKIDYRRLAQFIRGKSVIVTGGGGSIGAEICERLMAFGAARLLVIENSEPALHAVLEALGSREERGETVGRLADVRDRARMLRLIGDFKPDLVFHAAALKHVPLVEENWEEGVRTNIFGSVNVADAALAAGAAAMVMISTDKAIAPVSVLGATKRFAEMYCQTLDRENTAAGRRTRLVSVRFGNVLASNGSVVPKFKAQIEAGGPLTVTHPEMVRYFMTVREACDLVVAAADHALTAQRRDTAVYLLNMGQPVRILDLAQRMIALSGLAPGRDIEIVFTGIRPGERVKEELFACDEPHSDTGIAGILAVRPVVPPRPAMQAWLAALDDGLNAGDRGLVMKVLQESVTDFSPATPAPALTPCQMSQQAADHNRSAEQA
ncbi:MAG: polysaccharide biosynthesis protein [Hyphomicrobiales bacterium]|nr:polysaccharide biosynthesis protein [Hyphomicrobiales bacterium]